MAEQARTLLMGWVTNPFFPATVVCVFAAVAAIFALGWLRLRRQIRRLRQELGAEAERTQGLERIPKQIEEIRAALGRLDERTIPPGGWAPASESVHLNRRGQVMKLHRGGHSVAEIASNLGVAEGEVRLTLALHGLLRAPGSGEAEEFSLIREKSSDRTTRGLWVKGAGA